ncbi:cingulin-like protein 1 isoform X2 [Triplophysa dalaica]|uniref:cingulin-like protein 1 isoform X2 n=1 Tax=Triplophysa dalaica TaxID=1582913 RepID=UPI0024DF8A9A|nr:cingulin-like protein 1 isoform X2 [Triplophysa dalaica]
MESYHGDERLHPAQKDEPGLFGVQVQGINGRPCVVLCAQGKNVLEYPDVFLTEDPQQGLLSYMSGSASRIQTPPEDSTSQRKSPEILRPYDPRNIQSPPYHRHTAGRSGRVWFSPPPSPVYASPVMVKRARIPLPGADREVENIPCRTSQIICRPASGDDPKLRESPRLARLGHRSRMRPDDKRRSRSAESRSTLTDPETSGVEMEVESSSDASATVRQQEVTGVTSAEPTERSKVRGAEKSSEREAQVTPDLLRGQKELPDETTAKQVMLSYLREGSSDGEDAIRHRVDVLFEKIHMLKFSTVETLGVFEMADHHKEVKDLKDRRAALESQISQLKQQLQQESTNNEEKQKRLQEVLERSEHQQLTLRHKLTDMEKDLHTTLDQLLQVRRSRDACRADMRALQQQLSDIHDELDSSKSSEAAERDTLLQDLSALRAEFGALQDVYEEQEEVLHLRERELTALRGALEEEISAHARDVLILKEMHQREVHKLLQATEEAKESLAVLGQKVLEVAAEKAANLTHISQLSRTQTELQETIRALEEQITTLNDITQHNDTQKNLLEERVEQLRMENQDLEAELMDVRQQEEDMCGANRAVMRRLEDTQSEWSELNRAHRELKERLQEESGQMEELQERKRELEEQRTNQNREFERLQEEMSVVVVSSERETQRLQNQRCVLEDKLSRCEFELNEATMRTQQLQKRTQQLEENRHTHEDKHIKLMEVKVLELEKCLTDEQNSSDLLMKKLERGREQTEQVRSDLLQERAARQDLECDKISLERQNKDLRGRVSQLEACQWTGQDSLLSKLQLHIHEMEEKLLQEQKDNSDLQQQNRKLERKMKETTLHQEDERLSLQDQRDQLLLRLKSLKRLLDEAEEEIQRLENSKRKLQRDADEQQEINQQLQTQLSALRMDIRREKRPNTLQTSDDDDDDEEDERAVSSD